jgi:hypothetical protein
MIAFVGREAFDQRTLRMVAKSLGACVLVVVVDRLSTSIGWARILVDAVVYLAVVVSTGALRTGEMWRIATAAIRGKGRGGEVAAGPQPLLSPPLRAPWSRDQGSS